MSLIQSLSIINEELGKRGLSIDQLAPPADREELEVLEKIVGHNLPRDFIDFYLTHNGLSEWIHIEGDWEMLAIDYITKFYKENLDTFDNILSDDPWQQNWVPFASNGAGDFLFINLQDKQVGEYFHEGGFHKMQDSDFSEWVSEFAHDLQNGQYVFSSDYGLTRKV